jgi:hypothetical protein
MRNIRGAVHPSERMHTHGLSIHCDLSLLDKRQPAGNQLSKTAIANDQMYSYILAHRAVDYNAVVATLRQLKKHHTTQAT